jgi:hypothetical protein
MPEDHDKRAGFEDEDDFGEEGDFDDFDDDEAGQGWTTLGSLPPGSPPPGFPPPFGGRGRRDEHPARRGLLLAVTAVVAAGFAFGVADVALHDASGRPAADGTPSASTPTAGGAGGEPSSGPGNGVPSLVPGATMQLEIGGPVTAVSAKSITVGTGDRAVTAAVTSATKVTGKVTSIGGIKVGDVVSATMTGPNGKLVATSIQDPASLPSGPAQ